MNTRILSGMIGRTMRTYSGAVGDEVLSFEATDGARFRFWYDHDCCASCTIKQIDGDLSDLVGSPLVMAEEVCLDQNEGELPEYPDSFSWTFYKFRTHKGDVTVQWLGESNGYYNESVTYSEELPE